MVDFDIAEDGDEQPPEDHDNAAHTESYTTASEAAAAAPIQDVFGRTGSVSPQSGDYSASEIANFASTALSAIDAEIDAAATSVSGLDNVTNTHIGAGNPHSGSADTNHGNEAHSSNFAVDGATQPPENHGNGAHAESYITSGEAPVQSVNGETGDVDVGGIPSGLVAMWSGSTSNVPSGWTLCDGTDGTPDLQDRFVVGAGSQYNVNDTGGANSVQLTIDEIPEHSHSADGSFGFDSGSPNRFDVIAGSLDTQINTKTSGGGQAHENRPPYYALAYIMKV